MSVSPNKDILDSTMYCFSETIYDVIVFLICIIQKCLIYKMKTRYSKKENAFLRYFEKPFKCSVRSTFYFIGS